MNPRRTSIILAAILFAAVPLFIWQERQILKYKAERDQLRTDLQDALGARLETSGETMSLPARERLELIKLRNESRQLRESLADRWKNDVEMGRLPDFGSSLLH